MTTDESCVIFVGCRFLLSRRLSDIMRRKLCDHIEGAGGQVIVHAQLANPKIPREGQWYEVVPHGTTSLLEPGKPKWLSGPRAPEVVSSQWVHLSVTENKRLEWRLNPILKPLQCRTPMPGFSGTRIVISVYNGLERKLLRNLCSLLGASFSEVLKCGVATHLLCPYAWGPKYEVAKKLGMACVTKEWLLACVEADNCVPSEWYAPMPPEPGVVLGTQSAAPSSTRGTGRGTVADVPPPRDTLHLQGEREGHSKENLLPQHQEATSRRTTLKAQKDLMRKEEASRSQGNTSSGQNPGPSTVTALAPVKPSPQSLHTDDEAVGECFLPLTLGRKRSRSSQESGGQSQGERYRGSSRTVAKEASAVPTVPLQKVSSGAEVVSVQTNETTAAPVSRNSLRPRAQQGGSMLGGSTISDVAAESTGGAAHQGVPTTHRDSRTTPAEGPTASGVPSKLAAALENIMAKASPAKGVPPAREAGGGAQGGVPAVRCISKADLPGPSEEPPPGQPKRGGTQEKSSGNTGPVQAFVPLPLPDSEEASSLKDTEDMPFTQSQAIGYEDDNGRMNDLLQDIKAQLRAKSTTMH